MVIFKAFFPAKWSRWSFLKLFFLDKWSRWSFLKHLRLLLGLFLFLNGCAVDVEGASVAFFLNRLS